MQTKRPGHGRLTSNGQTKLASKPSIVEAHSTIANTSSLLLTALKTGEVILESWVAADVPSIT